MNRPENAPLKNLIVHLAASPNLADKLRTLHDLALYDSGDALLASAGAEVRFTNGFAVAGFVDSKLSGDSQSYSGTGRLSYSW